MSFNNSNLRW